jgi:hypothetical protein
MDVLKGQTEMFGNSFRLTFTGLVIVLIAGCASDVTTSSKYHFSSIANHCYVTLKDCEIMGGRDTQFFLIGVGVESSPQDPKLNSAEEYYNRINEYAYALLPAGTKVRVERLFYDPWTSVERYRVRGTIESGPLAGCSVEIGLFLRVEEKGSLRVNGRVFKECSRPQTRD